MLRRHLPTILLAAALALAGCRKPQPSPEFAQANELHSRLYAAQLDDAYLDPEMSQVEELLGEVPSSSSDFAAARELAAHIESERARVEAERQARQEAIAEALRPTPFAFSDSPAPSPPQAAPAAEEPDAGAAQPLPGMTRAEFVGRFSGCFRTRDPIEVEGRGRLETWELKDIANCRDRHPGFSAQYVLVEGGQVHALVARRDVAIELRFPDGGLADAGR